MNVNEILDEMKKIQTNLLDFLEHADNNEEKFQNLLNIFDDIKIHDNQFKIKPLIYSILKISNNHHREPEFFSKIEKILQLFKDDLKKYFTNNELFHIFKSNKRLLLFLFEENMLIIDESIIEKIINDYKYINAKYPQYFQPEIQTFINKNSWIYQNNSLIKEIKKKLPSDFYEKRKIGENDDEICKMIQNDLIDEFITYVNKNCYPIKSTIKSSIYETNYFLLKKENEYFSNGISLIEYAAFFGSIQIFNYLRLNGVELKSSLWIYAVYGQNPEIISLLEENKILPSKNDKISFVEIFNESIKCHHIDFSNYIQDNYLQI